MKKILSALFAAFACIFTASADEVTINPVYPRDGNASLYANTVNGLVPVAQITVNDPEKSLMLNNLYVSSEGSFLEQDYTSFDLVIIDASGVVVWQGSVPDRAAYHNFDMNIFVPKGKRQVFDLCFVRYQFVENGGGHLRLNFGLNYGPSMAGSAHAYSSEIVIAHNASVGCYLLPAQSVNDSLPARPGVNILGGFRLSMYSSSRWYGSEEFTVTDPTFRLYTSGGKPTDVTGLELYGETGALLLKGGKVAVKDGYSTITFKGKLVLPQGDTAIFVRGRAGATFRKAGVIMLGFALKDQGVMTTISSGSFISEEGRPYTSRQLNFGSKAVPATRLPSMGGVIKG